MKNLNRRNQIILAFSVAFLVSFAAFSQNILQEKPTRELKEVASEAAANWQKELALSNKQKDLMEKKIIEYAMKKNRLIQSKMREEAKTERLRALQREEYGAMRNILTAPQYERYLKLTQERIREHGKEHKAKGRQLR